MKGLNQLHRSVADNIDGEQERQARYYDAKYREPLFQTGYHVLKRNRILSSAAQGVSAKLARTFAEPYAIVAKTGINTYRIRALDTSDEELIHAEHLKPYVGATPSNEEQEEEPKPPRDSAAILAMSDPPVASDGETNSHVARGNDSMATTPDRRRKAVRLLRAPTPLPVRKPGPAAVRVIVASSPKNLEAKTRG